MKGKIENGLGEITVDTNVIAKYAGATAVGCFGIIGMAMVNVADGIVKLLKRDNITKGIIVEIDEENEINIQFHVIVAYGVCISTVCDNLISNVRYKVEEYTGMKVKKINVFVESVRVID